MILGHEIRLVTKECCVCGFYYAVQESFEYKVECPQCSWRIVSEVRNERDVAIRRAAAAHGAMTRMKNRAQQAKQ